MRDYKEIIAFWGKSNLVYWPPESIAKIRISKSAKEFLMNVGMPKHVDWTLKFYPSLKRLNNIPNYPNLPIVGYDDMMPICLDEAHSGCVILVEHKNNRVRFVNSSVELLGIFLMIYQQYRLKVRHLKNEEEIMSIIDLTENHMIESDNPAMADQESYWPVIIEQMRDGLL